MDGRLAAALNGAEGIDALTSAAQDLLADEGWIARLIAGAADALGEDSIEEEFSVAFMALAPQFAVVDGRRSNRPGRGHRKERGFK